MQICIKCAWNLCAGHEKRKKKEKRKKEGSFQDVTITLPSITLQDSFYLRENICVSVLRDAKQFHQRDDDKKSEPKQRLHLGNCCPSSLIFFWWGVDEKNIEPGSHWKGRGSIVSPHGQRSSLHKTSFILIHHLHSLSWQLLGWSWVWGKRTLNCGITKNT